MPHPLISEMLLINASAGWSRIAGRGLIARELVKAGTCVWRHEPAFDRAFTAKEVAALPPAVREQVERYAFWYEPMRKWVLDVDEGRHWNHSPTPNVRHRGLEAFAICDLSTGEELTIDYRHLAGTDSEMDLDFMEQATDGVALAPLDAQERRWSGLRVGRSGKLGMGLFADRRYLKGETVLHFRGPVLTLKETLKLGCRFSYYPVQIGIRPAKYVDVTAGGEPATFLNHACGKASNCGIRNLTELWALRGLKAGEQLLLDYSLCAEGDPEKMRCHCGGKDCRKVVGNFSDVDAMTQRYFLRQGAVSEFVIEALNKSGRLSAKPMFNNQQNPLP